MTLRKSRKLPAGLDGLIERSENGAEKASTISTPRYR